MWIMCSWIIVVIIPMVHARSRLSFQQQQNISLLLDSLLDGYDNSLRPDFGGPPTLVEIDINVRSMGPVSEIDMTYSMDCYFRQTWVDRRLSFTGIMNNMTLSISMLEKIWKPDTYFYNGKMSYVHIITVPNKFVRLEQDGRVHYSQRITIKASCPMNLENFPMDSQRCPLKVGSFGYSIRDVIYKWNQKRQVAIAPDMKMSQFDLIEWPSCNQTDTLRNGDFSTLLVSFHLQRHMGYFLIQVYAPCMLLVVLSWVAFWINREATADRVALGVTTVLTMTFLGLESRSDLPKVAYCTALDFFVAISFVFVFATIIQFALVHYFTKLGSGEVYFDDEASSDEEQCPNEENEEPVYTTDCSLGCNGDTLLELSHMSGQGNSTTPQSLSSTERCCHLVHCIQHPQQQCSRPLDLYHSTKALQGEETGHFGTTSHQPQSKAQRNAVAKRRHEQRVRRVALAEQINSVSKIDRVSRVTFPLTFLLINLFYWCLYLSRTKWSSSD